MKLKFKDMDVEASLRAVMERNTRHYQSDFEYDKARFLRAAQSENAEDKTLYWLSRPAGTWCFRERDIFIRDSEAFLTWQHYKDSSDSILAYTVEITGLENGRVMGTLYSQDYRAMAEHIDRAALTADTVSIRFEGQNDTVQYKYADYFRHRNSIHDQHGRAEVFQLDPADPAALRSILQNERAYRQRFPPGVFEAHIEEKVAVEKDRGSVVRRLCEAQRQAGNQTPGQRPTPKRDGPER